MNSGPGAGGPDRDRVQISRELWLRVLLALDSADTTFRDEVYAEVMQRAPAAWDEDIELIEELERLVAGTGGRDD